MHSRGTCFGSICLNILFPPAFSDDLKRYSDTSCLISGEVNRFLSELEESDRSSERTDHLLKFLLFLDTVKMADDFETFDDIQTTGVAPAVAELPEIKLFGRWSCDDVQVSDMSLQVRRPLISSLYFAHHCKDDILNSDTSSERALSKS